MALYNEAKLPNHLGSTSGDGFLLESSHVAYTVGDGKNTTDSARDSVSIDTYLTRLTSLADTDKAKIITMNSSGKLTGGYSVVTSLSDSSTDIPTSSAVNSAISTGFAANNALVFKGTYTATTSGAINTSKFSPVPSAATTTSSLGWMWIVTGVSRDTQYFGSEIVENGDLIISKAAQPGTTLDNYYLILKNIDPSTYVTLAGTLTITGTKTFSQINVTGPATFSQAINGDLLGTATQANRLSNAMTLELTGSVTGSVSFDGSGNVTLNTTTNHSHSYVNTIGKSGSTITWSINGTALTALDFSTTFAPYNAEGYLPLSGGTITGKTIFNNTLATGSVSQADRGIFINRAASINEGCLLFTDDFGLNIINTQDEAQTGIKFIFNCTDTANLHLTDAFSNKTAKMTATKSGIVLSGLDLTGNVTGNVTGNAATVTNGVYTIGDLLIAGDKTFTGNTTFSGSSTTMDSLTAGNLVVQGTSSLGTITSGTWNASTIAADYLPLGGTDSDTTRYVKKASNGMLYISQRDDIQSIGNGALTLKISDLLISNAFTANGGALTYTIPLATQVAKASEAADNSGTNTFGAIKGCAEGSTGEGAWRLCKVTSGLVYYYDRTNSNANVSTPDESQLIIGTKNASTGAITPVAKSLSKDSWSQEMCFATVGGTKSGTSLPNGAYLIYIEDSTAASNGTVNTYTGYFALNNAGTRVDEIPLVINALTSSDVNPPKRIFAGIQGKEIKLSCIENSTSADHYLIIKINRII